MFPRKLEPILEEWKNRSDRRPLILRGARQTGKTTLVRKFGEGFLHFVELNLEKTRHKQLFQKIVPLVELITAIEGMVGKRVVPGDTLLFLDEIQNSPEAIQMLRYFYEELPALHVIATGSLLEVRMKRGGWSYPVGRVEFLYLYPLTFDEFLTARGEEIFLDHLCRISSNTSLPAPLHDKARDLLAEYLIVGGMPAAVRTFSETRSFLEVRRIHEALAHSFEEDFAKYAGEADLEILRRVWEKIPYQMGRRVKFAKLLNHEFRSLKISQALNILHDAMLVEPVLPTVSFRPPLVRKEKAAPKFLCLDIGLGLSMMDLSLNQLQNHVFSETASGGLWESYVGQEILAMNVGQRKPLHFWVREEKGTSAEIDCLFSLESEVIPIEVKGGSQGTLRALHQFLNRGEKDFAVRIYDGPLRIGSCDLRVPQGKSLSYRLLSLPLYLTFRLKDCIEETKGR